MLTTSGDRMIYQVAPKGRFVALTGRGTACGERRLPVGTTRPTCGSRPHTSAGPVETIVEAVLWIACIDAPRRQNDAAS